MRWLRYAALLIVVLLPLLVEDPVWLNFMIMGAIYVPFALGFSVLFGYSNQVSFGQGGFFALGSYASAILVLEGGLSVWLAMSAGIVLPAIVAYVIGRPVLRLRGLSLGLATLAFGQMVYILALQLDITGGPIGLSGIPAPTLGPIDFSELRNFYWLALAMAVACFILSRNLVRSNRGRTLRALGDSEIGARDLGVNVESMKTIAFTYAAALSGLAGALYAHYFSFISSDSFGLDLSIMVIIMVMIGGRYSLWGAVIGAVLVGFLVEYLRTYQEYSQLIYGGLLIVLFMMAPKGLIGFLLWLRERQNAASAGTDRDRVEEVSAS